LGPLCQERKSERESRIWHVEPTHYHLYAQTAALGSQYFREGNIADYMRVPELLRNAL